MDPGIALLVVAIVLAALFLGVRMSQISDAIAANTAAVNALTAAAGSIDIATAADVSQVQTNTAAVNAVTTQLGGQPPA